MQEAEALLQRDDSRIQRGAHKDVLHPEGRKGKWRVFITTGTRLSFIKLMEIYQIRWTVEVFFKEAKQLLGLGRCQSNDFDAQIADTTITMIQYILLTLKFRFNHYETKGALFCHNPGRAH